MRLFVIDIMDGLVKKNMKNLFKKIFCLHKWVCHTKKDYTWIGTEIVEGTEDWYNPKFESKRYGSTKEVLICKDCGKIKVLNY